jgi:hypothetical protein
MKTMRMRTMKIKMIMMLTMSGTYTYSLIKAIEFQSEVAK